MKIVVKGAGRSFVLICLQPGTRLVKFGSQITQKLSTLTAECLRRRAFMQKSWLYIFHEAKIHWLLWSHPDLWCLGSALGHGHQCERSILVVPVQKLEHGTRVRALSPKVVFRHRTRARALVCTRFHQCHVFYPCFPAI